MEEASGTIFRVVGGGDPRKIPSKDKSMVEYQIIPYTLTHSSPSHYYIDNEGICQKHYKRTTSNSQYYEEMGKAVKAVLRKIRKAIKSIETTRKEVIKAPDSLVDKLFMAKFREEHFSILSYQILTQTSKAWKIDTGQTRERQVKDADGKIQNKTVPVGRSYIYPYESKPHNPQMPNEQWVGIDLIQIKKQVKLYASERIKYLRQQIAKIESWAETFEPGGSGSNE